MDYWLADCEAYNDPEAPNLYFPDFLNNKGDVTIQGQIIHYL